MHGVILILWEINFLFLLVQNLRCNMWPVDRDQYEMMEVDSDCSLEEYGKKHQLEFESHSFYLESSSFNTENSDMIIENKVVIHSFYLEVNLNC